MIELARDYWSILGIIGLLAFLYYSHRALIHCQCTLQHVIQTQRTQHDTLVDSHITTHRQLTKYIAHSETKQGEINNSLIGVHTSLSVLHRTLHEQPYPIIPLHLIQPLVHDTPEQALRVD